MLRCIDSNVNVNSEALEATREELQSVIESIRSLALILTVFCYMVAVMWVLIIVVGGSFAFRYACRNSWDKIRVNCQELGMETKELLCTMYYMYN